MRTVQAFTCETRAPAPLRRAPSTRAFEAARASISARAFLTAFAIFLIFASRRGGALDRRPAASLTGTMSGGTLGQFLLYAVFAAGALGQLSRGLGRDRQAAGAAERLAELLAEDTGDRRPADPVAAARARRAAKSPSRRSASPIRAGPTSRRSTISPSP